MSAEEQTSSHGKGKPCLRCGHALPRCRREGLPSEIRITVSKPEFQQRIGRGRTGRRRPRKRARGSRFFKATLPVFQTGAPSNPGSGERGAFQTGREREGNECIDARHERTLTHCPDERLRRRLLLHPLYRHARANGPLATPEFPNREHLEWRIVGKQWQTCNKQSVSDALSHFRFGLLLNYCQL